MDRFEYLEFLESKPEPEAVAAPAEPPKGSIEAAATAAAAAPQAQPILADQPKDGPSFYRAARAMREAGFLESAAKYYERAAGFDEHNHDAQLEYVDTLVRAGCLEAADHRSHAILDAYRQVRPYYASRALVLAFRGMIPNALQLSDVSVESELTWYALCVRAQVFLKASLEYREQALRTLEDALNLGHKLWEPHYIGGLVLLDAGWPALAAGYFSEAIHCNPRAAAGFIGLGDCFHALRLYDQAVFYYQRALDIYPKHEIARAKEKAASSGLFGLVRSFQRADLRARWMKEYDRLG